eukprot:SM000011S19173  [mRNA]  locus=s11:1222296:1225546:- [translate_table: standard]
MGGAGEQLLPKFTCAACPAAFSTGAQLRLHKSQSHHPSALSSAGHCRDAAADAPAAANSSCLPAFLQPWSSTGDVDVEEDRPRYAGQFPPGSPAPPGALADEAKSPRFWGRLDLPSGDEEAGLLDHRPADSAAAAPPEKRMTSRGSLGESPSSDSFSSSSSSKLHHWTSGELTLREEELRDVLLQYVKQRCCWDPRPARAWNFRRVDDFCAYTGTLESFVETRKVVQEREPYTGAPVDGEAQGAIPGPWDVSVVGLAPELFQTGEARLRLPHSESVVRCPECIGKGELPCSNCFTTDGMKKCIYCKGTGRTLSHSDASALERMWAYFNLGCQHCSGSGMVLCAKCKSRKKVRCPPCRGLGSVITRRVLIVSWTNLSRTRVSNPAKGVKVPEWVVKHARGTELFKMQALPCAPALFPGSSRLSSLSAKVLAERPAIPKGARLLCERHILRAVPITRAVMQSNHTSFSFYLLGLDRRIYAEDYPVKCSVAWCCCYGQICWPSCMTAKAGALVVSQNHFYHFHPLALVRFLKHLHT